MSHLTLDAVVLAQKTLHKNQECFAAQWILQNQDKNIGDYVLCFQDDWETGVQRMWMEKREGIE